jgi:hypothetical protein
MYCTLSIAAAISAWLILGFWGTGYYKAYHTFYKHKIRRRYYIPSILLGPGAIFENLIFGDVRRYGWINPLKKD